MGVYNCTKCKVKENTALGLYWSKHRPDLFIWDESNEAYRGTALCSECAPKKFNDGTSTEWGEWHGKFPKEFKERSGNFKNYVSNMEIHTIDHTSILSIPNKDRANKLQLDNISEHITDILRKNRVEIIVNGRSIDLTMPMET